MRATKAGNIPKATTSIFNGFYYTVEYIIDHGMLLKCRKNEPKLEVIALLKLGI